MKEVNFTFQPPMSISVNGQVFEIKASDADIYERAVAVKERYSALIGNEKASAGEIIEAVHGVSAVVDSILGAGAMAKIAAGHAVRVADALQVMCLILDAAAASYAEKLEGYE